MRNSDAWQNEVGAAASGGTGSYRAHGCGHKGKVLGAGQTN